MRIGLVYGGNTTEGEISKLSAAGVRGSLQKLGHEVVDIEFDQHIATHIQDANIDVVFNAMHGRYGEDGCLQGILDIMHIPYTHSGLLSSALGMNKSVSKRIFNDIGLLTARSIIVTKEELRNDAWKDKIHTSTLNDCKEVFVKPVCDGSSRDVFLVKDINEYSFKMTDFVTVSNSFLIEERIVGREIQVAVINNKAIGALEVIPNFNKSEFYDYNAKYTDVGHSLITPADIAPDMQVLVKQYAELVFRQLDCKGIVRVDFILDEEAKTPYFLEVNTIPGQTALSIIPAQVKSQGLDVREFYTKLLMEALV